MAFCFLNLSLPTVVETVRCIQEGNEQWTCKTNDMPAGVRFGRVSVLCEGYDYPDDPYVTEGSCGLEYSLLGTPHSNDFHGGSHDPRLGPRYARESRVGGGVGLLTVFFVLVFIWIVYKSCGQQIMAPPANYGGGGPAGGGGGPGPGCGPGMGMGMGGQGMGGGGAGFWTGAGMGGGLGYMAGRMFGGGGGGGYQQGYNRRNAANEGRFGPFGYEPAPGEQTRGYTPQRTQQPTTQTAYADTRRR